MKLSPKQGGDGWTYMPDDQGRVCLYCQQKITLKQTVWFDTMLEVTWHFRCMA